MVVYCYILVRIFLPLPNQVFVLVEPYVRTCNVLIMPCVGMGLIPVTEYLSSHVRVLMEPFYVLVTYPYYVTSLVS